MLLALPSLFSIYYVDAMTQVAIYAIVALGLGLLVGRVGLVSLGQAAVLAIGAWVAARLLFATALPYRVVLLLSGLITMVLGTLVGLPALRLRGLYLALITLMLAGAITVVLATTNFPNGGHGFLGYNGSTVHIRRSAGPASRPPTRPSSAIRWSSPRSMFLLVLAHVRARPGPRVGGDPPERIRGAGRGDQHHALQAVGVRAGVVRHRRGRRVLAGADRYLYSINFQTQDSITLLAVVLMGGAYSMWGAIMAAVAAAAAAGAAQQLGGVARLADDPVRDRGAAGADHRSGGDRRSGAEGRRAARTGCVARCWSAVAARRAEEQST